MNEIITARPAAFLAEIERDPRLTSPNTRRQYKSALSHFEEWRAGRPLTKTLVEEYCSLLQRRDLAPSSLKSALSAIRWWARRVADLAEEHLSPEEAEAITRQAERVISLQDRDIAKGSRVPIGRHIPEEDWLALIRAATSDLSNAGIRDAAMLAVTMQTGLRNAELRMITIDDLTYTSEGADLLIRHGKGDKQRVVPLFDDPLAALNRWIDIRGAGSGPIFCQVLKNGRIVPGDPLTYQATWKILQKRFAQSGLEKRTTWHDFRRTLAGMLFDQGEDVSTIQEQFGHANPRTTQAYDRRPMARRRAAIRSIKVSL